MKNKPATLVEANYDLFRIGTVGNDEGGIISYLPKNESLAKSPPELSELYNIFDSINKRHFEEKLPAVKIVYSDRMLMAGSYTPSRREIKIGKRYHKIFPGEVADTLKHEMIHILHPYHNRQFKEMARQIGASLKARSHPDLRGHFKYLYLCSNCGQEYPRRKRLRLTSCGICSPGRRFDPRFRLKLKPLKH